MMRRCGLLALAVGFGCGCGIQTDSQPRDVPEDKRELRDPDASTANATGAGRVYLVGPGEQHLLRSVPREAVSRQNLMEVLFLGPNDDELSAQYSSAIPTGTELLSTDSKGNVYTTEVGTGRRSQRRPGEDRAAQRRREAGSESEPEGRHRGRPSRPGRRQLRQRPDDSGLARRQGARAGESDRRQAGRSRREDGGREARG